MIVLDGMNLEEATNKTGNAYLEWSATPEIENNF